MLEHPVESQRLPAFEGLVSGHGLEIFGEEALQGRLQLGHLRPGVGQDLGPPLIVEQGVEQVLDRHVGVAASRRLAHGGLQGEVQLPPDLAHSFSTPARRG